MNGKEINLTSDNVIIKSNNFNVDKNGNMNCNNSNVNGTITSNNVNITGGKIKLANVPTDANEYFRIESNNGDCFAASGSRMWLNRGTGGTAIYLQGGYLDQASIILTNKDGTSTDIFGHGITTPTLTQTSLEEIKKNIEEYREGLEIIKNSKIYQYNFKSEEDTDKKHIGFVIGEKYNTPKQVIAKTGDGIDTYSMTSVLWQAVKELIQKVENLENKLEGGQ